MVTKEQALSIVEASIAERDSELLKEIKILYSQDNESAWCFYYQSRAYLEAGDSSQQMVGQGPMIVDKETGQLIELGSYYSIKKAMQSYLRYKATDQMMSFSEFLKSER